jgi:CHAT domain-containing protein/Tfp pilus assembly protein PilF
LAFVLFISIVVLGTGTRAQRFELPASPSTAVRDTSQDTGTKAAAIRLLDEGKRLIAEGTSASLENAVKKLEEALLLWQKSNDRHSEALTLSFIGKAFDFLGEKQKALDFYGKSFQILHEVGDKLGEAKTLNNIGLIYDARGEKRKALEFYNRSLPLLKEIKDRATEGITLVNMGLVYDSLGEKQKALAYYHQALTLLRASGEKASEAVTLNNLGFIYDSLGEKQKALDYFDQALPILRAMGDKRVEAVTLNNIGYVHDSLDDKKKALDYYKRALPVLRASGDRFKEAVTINNIGLVYNSLGQFQIALKYFTRALALRRTIGDRPGEAVTLGDAGVVYDALGQTQKALEHYNNSLRLSREVEDRSVEASTLRRIAILEENRGNFSAARSRMENALAIIEDLRTRITSQDLRASYFASVHKHFETYIAILMRMHRKDPDAGYDALALVTNERARGRSMLEMLTEAKADIREGVEPLLLERAKLLQNALREKADRQARLLADRQSIQQVSELRKEIESLVGEYQQLEAEIRLESPRFAALTQPVPLSLKEIQQQVLDEDTLLLEYSLGDKKSYLWALTPTTLKSFELPSRAEIDTASKLVYSLLTARNQHVKFETIKERTERIDKADRDYVQASERLSSMLLGPVAAQLGKKRLLIVGDGVLDYVPFAALPSVTSKSSEAYQPLMLEHEVVTLPSASTLALLRQEVARREPAKKTIAVIADPVFDKEDARIKPGSDGKKSETRTVLSAHGTPSRDVSEQSSSPARDLTYTQEGPRIQRLPFTRQEAEAILALVPIGERMRAVDFEANRDAALNPELGKYRFIHFATHGVLNSQYPELSGLVLSLVNREGLEQDGVLWAHEVFNLHLPVEMVVLSGCRTGLGKAIRGEGLIGLTRGFMYAGAKRVVVSLWDISDEASAELMTQFYKGMFGKDRLRPPDALRAAQTAVMKDQRWQAPYYWAAFVIQGEAN